MSSGTTVSATWTGEELQFVGHDKRDREIKIGKGNFAPTHLVLIGLAGCMGMDIVHVLKKKRQTVTGVKVEVTGYQPDGYPKPYEKVEVVFHVAGHNVDPKAVERAIQLSHETYCMVGQTLQQKVEIIPTYQITEAVVDS